MTGGSTTFVGRAEEGRAVALAVRAGRSVVLIAPPAYGKTALIDELRPALEQLCVTLHTVKLAPFGQWLMDLFLEFRRTRLPIAGLTYSQDAEADLKTWKKAHPGNETRAKSLVDALRAYKAQGVQPPCILIDDATGLSQSMVSWLAALTEVAALVFCVLPETLNRANTRRLWQRCDRVDLPALQPKEAGQLVDALSSSYGIVAEDPGAYRARVLSLSGGVPGEVERLVRFVSTEAIVKKGDIGSSFAQQVAMREERGVALSPLLLVAGGGFMITKYLGLARGEMDLYLIGGVGIASFIIFGPLMRKITQVR